MGAGTLLISKVTPEGAAMAGSKSFLTGREALFITGKRMRARFSSQTMRVP
jgi:hypothetical protein